MIALVKQYLIVIGWFLSTAVLASSLPNYSKGVQIGTLSTNSSSVQGIACGQRNPEHLYILSGPKVLLIEKASTKLISTVSVQETDNSDWSWDTIAVGSCDRSYESECIYLARRIEDRKIRIIRFQVDESINRAHEEKLAVGNDVTIQLPSTSPAAARSTFIAVNSNADITLLLLEDNAYVSYQIESGIWNNKGTVRLSTNYRNEVTLQHAMTFKSLSWSSKEGKVVAQVKDTSNEIYMFSGHNAIDSLATILERKGHHVKLRSPKGREIESICMDAATADLYAIVSGDPFSVFMFSNENADDMNYQSDQPQSSQQSRQATCEDKNKHCSTWAQNGMCLKRKSYMIEYCPKSCQTCRESERMTGQPKCVDRNHLCAVWAEQGNCIAGSSYDYMQENCKKSCKVCSKGDSPMSMCRDEHQYCYGWADAGRCKSRPDYMHKSCKASCGMCSTTSKEKSLQSDQALNPSPATGCKDMSEYCESWAKEGKCESRKDYMFLNCPASCGLCGNRMEDESNRPCEDSSEYCPVWEAYGYCKAKANYMKVKCPAACGQCRSDYRPKTTSACVDHLDSCQTYASHMMCSLKPSYMKENCPKSCGKCEDDNYEEISNRILDSRVQPTTEVTTVQPSPTKGECEDKSSQCNDWVKGGYCSLRPDYMTVYCKKACDFCTGSVEVVNTPTRQREELTRATTTEIVTEATKKEIDGCVDKNSRCSSWAKSGYCSIRPDYMDVNCRKSCDSCDKQNGQQSTQPTTTKSQVTSMEVSECKDSKDYCTVWAAANLCQTKPQAMLALCPASCNVCQREAGKRVITTTTTTTTTRPTTTAAKDTGCTDKSHLCSYWQAAGFCTNRELYMKQTCPKACNLCGQQQQKAQCVDKNQYCATWAKTDRCRQYKSYMKANCAKSCSYCKDKTVTTTMTMPVRNSCKDNSKYCKRWARKGYCDIRSDYMSIKCKKSCKLCGI